MSKIQIELDLTTMQYRRLVEDAEEAMDAASNPNSYEAFYQLAKAISDAKGWELTARDPATWKEDQSAEWREEQQAQYDEQYPTLPDMPAP
ncbi:MAG: hypothetical protein ABSG46_20590 [Candidatus Binataceae bacterium]|jgi:hypothetical protein